MTDQQPAPGPRAPSRDHPSATAEEPGGPEVMRERKFRRDPRHRRLGGVCAGLGRHCDMDPVIFRIGLAVLAVTSGLGLVFYGFAWLLIPYEGEEENEARRLLTARVDGHALTAVLFALVGCGVFLTLIGNGGALTFAAVLGILLAGAGYWSRQRGAPDPDPAAAQAVSDAPPETKAPPVTGAPSWWRTPLGEDGPPKYFWGPEPIAMEYQPAPGHTSAWGAPPLVKEPRGRRGPRWIGGWVFLAALLAAGLGTGLTWEDQPLGTSLQTGFACALAVFGLGIAVSSFLGRTGAGSLLLAVITAALVATSAALPKNISTDWIRTDWTPATAADIRPRYELGTGVATLDLSRVDLRKDQTVRTRAEVGAGKLKVIVPKDAKVGLRVEVGLGDIQLPSDDSQDVDIAPDKHKRVTLDPPAGVKGEGTLDLRLEVGVGQAEVARAAS
ncbi:PspC domain-containing protein [Streptomyces spectabilis]|uniref:PspC domain-containing protein n=1 Tax=Streptomyces spectabilis TaxID=68270 RepID=A0A516RC63_STRST|nr:PspC domain-containing protein [Streptomyces spectabilis]